MRKIKSLLNIVLLITITSCTISFTQGIDVKEKRKTIDNKTYLFLSEIKNSNKNILGFKSWDFNAKIMFSGISEHTFKENLSLKDFEKKSGFEIPKSVVVDSISFTVNDSRDRIKLIYYLNNMALSTKVSFNLNFDGKTWRIER